MTTTRNRKLAFIQASEVLRLRQVLSQTVGALQHFKADAECNLACIPSTVQSQIDRINSVLDGTEEAYAPFEFVRGATMLEAAE